MPITDAMTSGRCLGERADLPDVGQGCQSERSHVLPCKLILRQQLTQMQSHCHSAGAWRGQSARSLRHSLVSRLYGSAAYSCAVSAARMGCPHGIDVCFSAGQGSSKQLF